MATRKLYPRKRYFFLIEKYIEDARQDEKHVPDLLEAIIQPPGPVKEELRQKLSKMKQIMSKIKKIRVSTFEILENPKFSRRRPMPAFSPVSFKQETIFHTRINRNHSKKMRVLSASRRFLF